MKPTGCPDCGNIESWTATGLEADARCTQCDGLMHPRPDLYRPLGVVALMVGLILAVAWIVLRQ
jgi:hypothetical protein